MKPETKARTLTVKAAITVPRAPNFITTADSGTLPVSAFTDEGLREIGALWTEKLIANANRQRKAIK